MTAPRHRADVPPVTVADALRSRQGEPYVPRHRRERGPVGHHTTDGWTWIEADRV